MNTFTSYTLDTPSAAVNLPNNNTSNFSSPILNPKYCQKSSLLHCALAAVQRIVIGPVCLWVRGCVTVCVGLLPR